MQCALFPLISNEPSGVDGRERAHCSCAGPQETMVLPLIALGDAHPNGIIVVDRAM